MQRILPADSEGQKAAGKMSIGHVTEASKLWQQQVMLIQKVAFSSEESGCTDPTQTRTAQLVGSLQIWGLQRKSQLNVIIQASKYIGMDFFSTYAVFVQWKVLLRGSWLLASFSQLKMKVNPSQIVWVSGQIWCSHKCGFGPEVFISELCIFMWGCKIVQALGREK